MKKLFLLLFVIASLNLDAQYLTSYAKDVNTKDVDGFYYHLPRNVIRLDLVIEKQQFIKGKYAVYAKEMLNTDNYVKENKVFYRIKSVNINTLTEADPNYVFFITADEKNKDNLNVNMELSTVGVIQSYGYKNHEIVNSQNFSFEEVLDYDVAMSEYNYISIRDEDDDEDGDGTASKLTEKEIAASIIEEIKNIRVAYFDLITGYQEVDYGTTMNYMIDELKSLENEYIALFLGKSDEHTFTTSFYIIPEKGKNSVVIGKFSDMEGLNAKDGKSIKVNFLDSSIGSNVVGLSKDDIENETYSNKLFYRNPANVTMQVMVGEEKISENRLTINQFGNVVLVPMNKMKFVFDANTGQILSIIKD